ncbi:hypothetical protein E4U17_005569 [Claviceps sp. LM77 group G4]|nr:hypothetical protein E4U17_005569 [Claviceps sp. LM77 group G4]KAG6072590.1 hypothetical protein E4U33_003200 [Claviceps sp. LM78 group G4]KAG6075302.1 hypothetical protein E4U16_003484 [Claviceps sp. LM84 group G4]
MPCHWTRLFLANSRSESAHVFREPVEEARCAERLKYFHPTEPGQILDGRFRTIAKLGYGRGSTVWLAENLECKIWSKSKLPRYVSIKITAIDIDDADEKGFLKLISNANPSHEGLKYIRVPLDTFDLQGENGTHSCLVFQPMGETLQKFQQDLPGGKFQLPLFKAYMYLLLQSLDYLHTECRLIHTDIKADNIMTSPMTDSDIKLFANHCKTCGQPRYIRQEDGRVTYMSHDEIFGRDYCHSAPVQTHAYRAPEVFLGMPWSYKVDIWNLGLLMWNLLGDVDLFENSVGEDGKYDAHVHLAQLISMAGKAPALLVRRERLCRENKLDRAIVNPRGKECETMNEYWGGPFFDDEGCMIRKDLIKEWKGFPEFFNELTEKDRSQFRDLCNNMMGWVPETRKTAAELLQHPFFYQED